jgi:DnaJ-class molecular chaperone
MSTLVASEVNNYNSIENTDLFRNGIAMMLNKLNKRTMFDGMNSLAENMAKTLYVDGKEFIKDFTIFKQDLEWGREVGVAFEINTDDGQKKSVSRLLMFLEMHLNRLVTDKSSAVDTCNSLRTDIKNLALGLAEFVKCRCCDGTGLTTDFEDNEVDCWNCYGSGKVIEMKEKS